MSAWMATASCAGSSAPPVEAGTVDTRSGEPRGDPWIEVPKEADTSATTPPNEDAAADGVRDTPTDGDEREGDGSSGLDATEICRRAITLYVERTMRCFGYDVDYAAQLDACPDYYFNVDSNRTVEQVAACLDELATRPCSDLDLNMTPLCLVGGKRPGGAGCLYPSQCESNMCEGILGGCSTCRAGNLPPGSTCDRFACAPGTFCNEGTDTCVDGSSVVYAKEGEPCTKTGDPVVVCEGDLLCRNDGVYINTSCRDGQRFNCGSRQCGTNEYCKDKESGTCAPHAKHGEACSLPPYEELPPCAPPERCWNGKCAVRRVSGESCDADQPCSEFFECVNGTCQHLVCPA